MVPLITNKYHCKSNTNVHLTANGFYNWRTITYKTLKWGRSQSLTVHQPFT